MDYQLEQLGPDRFQDLVQALLAKELQGVQCFPVGMADGGRDATSRSADAPGFAVFQVKFAKGSNAINDPHSWVLKALKNEAPKLRRLIDRGASAYYMVTNVGGTGQLDLGAIDKATAILDESLGIPFMVWWRTDVNRRLDTSMDLKWLYPEVMTGQDALRVLFDSSQMSSKARIERATRAYLRDQYSADSEVRFRQTELQGSLIDLYVDVPITIRDLAAGPMGHRRDLSAIIESLFNGDAESFELGAGHRRWAAGAATFLLNRAVFDLIPWAVLEGAPGQGKSTVTQYLCQVHRIRLLNERQALKNLDEGHVQAPLRFPIKFEARDFAAWLGDTDSIPDSTESKTLEAFIARQIHRGAGGQPFDIGDLVELAASQPVLLVIDGLDEVANIQSRRAVVRQTTAGLERLKENAQSMQVLITTRPAAFSNTPGFSRELFDYLHLTDLSAGEVKNYADRWAKARNLSSAESEMTNKILMSGLEQPHLRDLARNPMQLAILLSLIVARGSSLPDQRTALYDAYIDVFLNREAEKSEIVRDHRQTLVNLHQFLGWLLHAQAEEGSDGRITLDSLRSRIQEFLTAEDLDPTLTDGLMIGAVDRVVALVSRIEGTYEFEVQPLREYFAARFLYDTAPYSPAGANANGTKPERFAGLGRSPYWLNVARFFAGCYDRGELPSLADQLDLLAHETPYRESGLASQLSWLLLSDQVFSQDRHAVRRVVKNLTNDNLVLQVADDAPVYHSAALPPGNGRDEISTFAFDALKSVQHFDVAFRLAELVRSNADNEVLRRRWAEEFRSLQEPAARKRWAIFGAMASVFRSSARGDWVGSWLDEVPDAEVPWLLLSTGLDEIADSSEETAREVVDIALADGDIPQYGATIGPAAAVVHILGPWILRPTHRVLGVRSRGDQAWHGPPLPSAEKVASTSFNTKAYQECAKLCREFVALASEPGTDWASRFPQLSLAETAHRTWGDKWLVRCLGLWLASTAAEGESVVTHAEDLLDGRTSIVDRVHHMYRNRNSRSWWEGQINAASVETDREFALSALLSWGTGRVVSSLAEVLLEATEALSGTGFRRVYEAVGTAHWSKDHNQPLRIANEQLLAPGSVRTSVLLAHRATRSQRNAVLEKVLAESPHNDPIVSQMAFGALIADSHVESLGWPEVIRLAEALYDSAFSMEAVDERYLWFDRMRLNMPLQVAEPLWNRWDELPAALVRTAQAAYRWQTEGNLVRVGRLANSGGWFHDRYHYANARSPRGRRTR